MDHRAAAAARGVSEGEPHVRATSPSVIEHARSPPLLDARGERYPLFLLYISVCFYFDLTTLFILTCLFSLKEALP